MFSLKNDQNKLLLYFIYIFVFLYFTTDYLNLYDLIYVANQSDIISFFEIAKKSPEFSHKSDIIAKHDAQRFIVPYFIGLISYITNIDLFSIYKVINFFLVFSCLLVIKFVSKKLNLDFRSSIVFFSLFFCNPYTVRYGLFNPVQVQDMVFFIFGFIISYGILYERNKLIFCFSLLSLFLRQTAIAYLISIILFYFFKIKYFGKKLFFYYLVLSLLILYLTIQVGNYMSTSNFPISNAYNLIFYDFSKKEELLRFLALPLISFAPLMLVLLSEKKVKLNLNLILIFFISLMMIAQPILGGPLNSGRNVVRIATLCYPVILVGIFNLYNFSSLLKNNLMFYTLLLFFHIWSLHPTFSIFDFFGILRF